jgi:tetratricopeptide (TPR) repeat protein
MMRFQRPPEPDEFDAKVRQPGNAWLAKNIHKKKIDCETHAYWRTWKECIDYLADGFNHFCAYACIQPFSGVVDHYLSKTKHPNQAYEWSNYRYASSKVNEYKSKFGPEQILDPFEVEDDWFEILLPSLQLVLTDAVPAHQLERAKTTLKALQLMNGKWIIRTRIKHYKQYNERKLSIEGLEEENPLIARAVKRCQDSYQKGNEYYNCEDYQIAIQNYNEAIRINAVYAEAYLGRGQAYYQLKDYQNALKDYDEAIHQNPEQFETFFWRGLIHYQSKNYNQAIEDFTQIIQQYPNKGEAYYFRGSAYKKSGKSKLGIQDIKKAAELLPVEKI